MENGHHPETRITLAIDGRTVSVAPKTTILDAAKTLGIDIPTLCYHKRLTPIGSCRVCLVNVEGVALPVASCTTPVTQNMKVTTTGEELERLRKQSVQFILLNHPLECTVCDKAGECDLQDTTYKLGVDHQEYELEKVNWKEDNSSPLIFRSHGRCIRCGRCVAICNEVQNVGALDFKGHGYDARIDPTTGETLDCEYCGQCVSVCPVGALILQPFKNKVRVWDLKATKSVCTFCGAGCSFENHVQKNTLFRVESRREKTHNLGDLCARGTFGFHFLKDKGRIRHGLEKIDGAFAENPDTKKLIAKAVARLMEIVKANGPESFAALGSSRMPNEDAAAFAAFVKDVVKSPHLDTEAGLGYRQTHELCYGGPKGAFNDMETCDGILLFGSDLAVEMPVPSFRVIAAAKAHDAKVIATAPYFTKLHHVSTDPIVYAPGNEVAMAFALAKAAVEQKFAPADRIEKVAALLDRPLAEYCEAAGISEQAAINAAGHFFTATKKAMVVGQYAILSENTRHAAALLCRLANPELFFVSAERANMQGVTDVGCKPGPGGLDYLGIFNGIKSGQIKALWLAGSDPLALLGKQGEVPADLELLVVQDPFESQAVKYAHFVIPSAPWGSKSGTTTSAEGRTQALEIAVSPLENELRDAAIFSIAEDEFAHSEKVNQKVRALSDPHFIDTGKGRMESYPGFISENNEVPQSFTPVQFEKPFTAITGQCLFVNGTTTARSESLRKVCGHPFAAFSPADLERLGIAEGEIVRILCDDGQGLFPVKADEKILPGVVLIPGQFSENNSADLFGGRQTIGVSIEKS